MRTICLTLLALSLFVTGSQAIAQSTDCIQPFPATAIPDDPLKSLVARVVWTGSEYGVAWRDWHAGAGHSIDIHFTRLDASGNLIGHVERVTNDPGESRLSSLAWTGSEYGIAWYDDRDGDEQIYFARLDAVGNKIGGDIRITQTTSSARIPSLVWADGQYGIAWQDYRDGNYEIYFARLDASGNKFGNDVRVTNAGLNSQTPSLVWTGSQYGIAWRDARNGVTNEEIYFTRLNASGVEQGDDVRVTVASGHSTSPSLVWAGGEFGLAWDDNRDGAFILYFTRLNASGIEQGDDVKVLDDIHTVTNPSLVWTGINYALAWDEAFPVGDKKIGFTRMDATGKGVGKIVRLSLDNGDSRLPDMVWSHNKYGIVWGHDFDSGDYQSYFAQLACGCSGFENHSNYGRLLFPTRCTQDASSLTEDVYDSDTVGVNLGSSDTFYLSSDGMSFAPLAVDDAVDVDGQDAGLGPYAPQPGVPPFRLDVPIEHNLVPLPAHDITSLLSSGPNPGLFELLDTDRSIYGHTAVYLVRDCGISVALKRPTTLHWHSHDVEVEGFQSDLDVVSGLLSELQADQDFSRACFLVAVVDDTEAVDLRRNPPLNDGYYYLVNGTCAKLIGYGNSSTGPRGDLGGAPSCN